MMQGLCTVLVAVVLAASLAPARAESPNGVKTLDPPGSLGARAGDFIFVAGMQGVDPATNKLVEDPQARIRQAFVNIKTDRSVGRSEPQGLRETDRLSERLASLRTTIAIGGATLDVGFAPGAFALPRSALMASLSASAKAASVYFGKFPVASASILIVPIPGGGVQGGASFGFRGPVIRLIVGSDATEAELRDDWVAVHEMTHLAQPDIREPHLWLAEGSGHLCRADRAGRGRSADRRNDLGRHDARHEAGIA